MSRLTGTVSAILSIDIGTSGPKVALVRADGSVAASTARGVDTKFLPGGGAEQDPEALWQAVADAVIQVVRAAGPHRVAGITVAGQFFSVVGVDRAIRPTTPLLLWMDGRGATQAHRLHRERPEAIQRWLAVHGMVPLPSGNDTLSHMLWVRDACPAAYARTHAFLEPADFVTARLSGRCTANACTAFAMLLTDNRDPGSVGWDETLIAAAGIDARKLPDLVAPFEVVGTLEAKAARALGLPPRTPVLSGCNDTQAVAVGTGTSEGHGALNVGTTGQVLAHVDVHRTDLESEIVSAPSPIAGRYVAIAENGIAAKALDHFLGQVVFARDALGDHGQDDRFRSLEEVVASVEPGSGGLLFLPWLTGSASPSSKPYVRGAFLNLSLETTRAHMVRAVLEGVAFSLRWLLPEVERFAERRFPDLRFSGGGARSAGWSQILADVTGRPIHQLADPRHVINRATAWLGFRSLGQGEGGGVSSLCPVARVFEPRSDVHERYERIFVSFRRAFEANRPVFEGLNT